MRRSIEEIWLLSSRSLRRSLRNRTVVVSYLFQPLLYLLVFTKVFSSVAEAPGFGHLGYGSYLSFFLPALLVLGVLAPAMTSGLATIVDLHTGALDGFLRTPVRRSSVLAGKLVADAARMVVASVVVVAVAIPLGARTGNPLQVAAAIALACTMGLALAGLSNLVALRTRSTDATSALANLAVLPLMFLSTAYMPRELLPRWLQLAASANPLSYVIDGARWLLTPAGPAPATNLLVGIGVVVLLGSVTMAGSVRAFRRAIS